MTVYELIEALKQQPEGAEVLIYDLVNNWSGVIDDKTPLREIEHDQDGTPILWIYCA